MSNRDEIRHFPTDVVGVSLSNDDGTSRQEIIGRCRRFERLSLEPEEGTSRDLPTIRVRREDGEQIGCLRPEVARQILAQAKAGHSYTILLKDFTGDETPSKSRGVKLLIIEAELGVGDRKIENYARKLTTAGQTKPFNQVRLFVLAVVVTTVALLIWC